jgi:cysteinyl-tRNA synthetase
LNVDGLKSGARVQAGEKRNPTDFALWKFSRMEEQRQMEWDSPWGTGFPGWHIECSAMAAEYLGSFFDIHCGGEDHIMVHHPNEIAQTQACHQTRLANFWMHGYFLQIDSSRMGKSVGNFITLQTLSEQGYEALVWRLYCLGAHYRSKLNFSWEGLDSSKAALNRLRNSAHEWGAAGSPDDSFLQSFLEQINDDLNMPRALALVWELLKSDLPDATKKATLLLFDRVLGLGLAEWQPEEISIPQEIMQLVQQRQEARQAKRWTEADELREQVRQSGYEIEDTSQGPRVRSLK